ncbi:hypothetical protein HU200_062609 [Digitaria exilis]|uniref:CCHC-type domain-containing protein n=1 Tax=Digitaria exilis TaxID=1010633 RepID=A0A835DX89_9POAL|nr:hypothetical protein HU200_062609 [Digitaria exilis]
MLLMQKAGDRRCLNCLALHHRIAQCRDPPRCILCSRCGHKARFCPNPPKAPLQRAAASRLATSSVPAGKRAEPVVATASPHEGVSKAMDYSTMVPGDPSCRPHRVLAAAARSQDMQDLEREIELLVLVAVLRNAQTPLSGADILRDARQQLRIPQGQGLAVSFMAPAMFLLRF